MTDAYPPIPRRKRGRENITIIIFKGETNRLRRQNKIRSVCPRMRISLCVVTALGSREERMVDMMMNQLWSPCQEIKLMEGGGGGGKGGR